MKWRRKKSNDYVSPRHWTLRLKRALRFGWLALCVAVLAVWWFGGGFVDGAGHRVEQRQFLEAAMGILAFPAGLLWVWFMPYIEPLAQSVAYATGIQAPGWQRYGPAIMMWSGAVSLGYLQWFWLLPGVVTSRRDV